MQPLEKLDIHVVHTMRAETVDHTVNLGIFAFSTMSRKVVLEFRLPASLDEYKKDVFKTIFKSQKTNIAHDRIKMI